MSATINITAKALRNAALLFLFPGSLLIAQTPAWSTGQYTYDGAGNISQIGTDQYSYDSVGRLVKGTAGPGHDQSYSYDPFGNITKVVTDGNAGTAMIPSMDPAKNRLASTLATGTTVRGAYDAAGNLIDYQGSLSTYRYDGLNMLKEIQGGGQHELYVYTADNERIAAIALGGTSILSYRWTIRGLDQKVLRQFDQTVAAGGDVWSWKEDYVYANGQLLAAETSTSDHLHFFTDHLGTPRLITNGDGLVVSRHTYYPFGEEATSAAQDSERLKFTGHERDATLDYMHARFSNASLGRFLSVDPVVGNPYQPQSWNGYSYVTNNPINRTDPDGRCSAGLSAIVVLCAAQDTVNGLAQDYHDVKDAITGMGRNASGSENLMGAGVLGFEAAKYGVAFIPVSGAAEVAVADATSQGEVALESAMARGRANEARVLQDMGLTKNTQKVSVGGKTSIPDGMDATRIVEVKDTKVVSNTARLRTQRSAAQATNREHVVVTGQNTHVRPPVKAGSTVIRRPDIGPQQ